MLQTSSEWDAEESRGVCLVLHDTSLGRLAFRYPSWSSQPGIQLTICCNISQLQAGISEQKCYWTSGFVWGFSNSYPFIMPLRRQPLTGSLFCLPPSQYPYAAVACGFIYIFARIVYFVNYASGDPEKRLRGMWVYDFPCALWLFSHYPIGATYGHSYWNNPGALVLCRFWFLGMVGLISCTIALVARSMKLLNVHWPTSSSASELWLVMCTLHTEASTCTNASSWFAIQHNPAYSTLCSIKGYQWYHTQSMKISNAPGCLTSADYLYSPYVSLL